MNYPSELLNLCNLENPVISDEAEFFAEQTLIHISIL